MNGKLDVVDGGEGSVVQRVQADGHAVEAGLLELPGTRDAQQRAVGGEREVLDAGNPGKPVDQLFDLAAHEGLSPGDANLAYTVLDEQAHDTLDFFERQQRLTIEERVIGTEQLLGHAVDASEVTAVRHGDAQIAQGPLAHVYEAGAARALARQFDIPQVFTKQRRVL